MRIYRLHVVVIVLLVLATFSGCLEGIGVCTGYSAQYDRTYCKDGWDKSECEDWDEQKINGVDWHFHEGRTCEERGTPATA